MKNLDTILVSYVGSGIIMALGLVPHILVPAEARFFRSRWPVFVSLLLAPVSWFLVLSRCMNCFIGAETSRRVTAKYLSTFVVFILSTLLLMTFAAIGALSIHWPSGLVGAIEGTLWLWVPCNIILTEIARNLPVCCQRGLAILAGGVAFLGIGQFVTAYDVFRRSEYEESRSRIRMEAVGNDRVGPVTDIDCVTWFVSRNRLGNQLGGYCFSVTGDYGSEEYFVSWMSSKNGSILTVTPGHSFKNSGEQQ